jgi:hypothetical protein
MRGQNCLSNAPNCRFLVSTRFRDADTCPGYNLVVVNARIMLSDERKCLNIELK